MAKIEVLGISNCDTCKKALRALQASGADALLLDIRDEPLSASYVSELYALFGAALLNTRSTTWRGLSDAERSLDPLLLLGKYPTLMKRPVIRSGDRTTLGWTKEVQTHWAV
ncbi:MAG: ArsC/Spx/MgsR family protein [Pseudomonadota bacterium]